MGEPEFDISVYDQVSRRVGFLRLINKTSQKELAFRIGMHPAALSKKAKGGARWNLEDVIAISEVFDVTIDYLIGKQPIESAMPVRKKAPTAIAVGAEGVGRAGLEPATDGL